MKWNQKKWNEKIPVDLGKRRLLSRRALARQRRPTPARELEPFYSEKKKQNKTLNWFLKNKSTIIIIIIIKRNLCSIWRQHADACGRHAALDQLGAERGGGSCLRFAKFVAMATRAGHVDKVGGAAQRPPGGRLAIGLEIMQASLLYCFFAKKEGTNNNKNIRRRIFQDCERFHIHTNKHKNKTKKQKTNQIGIIITIEIS